MQQGEDYAANERDKFEPGGGGTGTAVKQEPVKVGPKIGRNDPCPCGSGKKYKHCHGKDCRINTSIAKLRKFTGFLLI